jgi:hypothetical protein
MTNIDLLYPGDEYRKYSLSEQINIIFFRKR